MSFESIPDISSEAVLVEIPKESEIPIGPEIPEVPEVIEREFLVALLRDYKPSDTEALDFLDRYMRQVEAMADEESDGPGRLRANVTVVLVYVDAGPNWIDHAWTALNDALEQAINAGDEEIVQELETLQNKIDGTPHE